jgi:hypothetical protein
MYGDLDEDAGAVMTNRLQTLRARAATPERRSQVRVGKKHIL